MISRTHTSLFLTAVFGLPMLIAGCTDAVVEEPAAEVETTETAENEAQTAEVEETEEPHDPAPIEKLTVSEEGKIGYEVVDFKATLESSDELVLVDFWATWCGPCVALAPELKKLAKEHQGKITIVKVDVDQAKELAQEYGVSSIPDMRIFKGGEQIEQMVGLTTADKIASQVGL